METTGNIVICPSCGAENIEGVDTCENCLMDLRTVDVPVTHQVEGESDLLELLSSARLSKPRVMRPGATVREAVRVLAGEPTGAVVVADGDRVVGIFTERDVLKRIAAHQERLDDPIEAWMTADPVVLRETDTMAFALNKMGDGGFRHLPLLREGRIDALVTARDIMHWLMTHYFD